MSEAWVRWVLAAIVVVVLGGTIVGIDPGGDGSPEATAPAKTTSASSRTALATLGVVADRGRKTFADNGCGGCHRLADARSEGTIGPDLDASISADTLATIRRDIVDPSAEGTPGYPDGRMPDGYARLSKPELDDLVRYLQAATSGR
ncbi:cytochrome c [Patulibacter sp. NPDC049589]|uniref:c-type cytochrome n=1 Tax=Patulibacter sp. NPDC049589 TaxID=3154731 RepID=UPI00342EF066